MNRSKWKHEQWAISLYIQLTHFPVLRQLSSLDTYITKVSLHINISCHYSHPVPQLIHTKKRTQCTTYAFAKPTACQASVDRVVKKTFGPVGCGNSSDGDWEELPISQREMRACGASLVSGCANMNLCSHSELTLTDSLKAWCDLS